MVEYWDEPADAVRVHYSGNQADNNATESGAVYFFSQDGPSWAQLGPQPLMCRRPAVAGQYTRTPS